MVNTRMSVRPNKTDHKTFGKSQTRNGKHASINKMGNESMHLINKA